MKKVDGLKMTENWSKKKLKKGQKKDGKSICAVTVTYQPLYSSMINRGNNNPHTFTMGNCIPLLTITTNAHYRMEKLTADIPLLCAQLWA